MRIIVTTGMVLSLIFTARACKPIREGSDFDSGRQNSPPAIEIAPLEQGDGQWKIAPTEMVTVTVTAPGAEHVRVLGRPEIVEEDYLEIRRLAPPVDPLEGRFVAPLKLAPDFAGDLWAEAVYPDGSKKRTGTVLIAVNTAGAGPHTQLDVVGGSVGTDESARSDKLNGGGIKKTKLIAGEPDVRITVNAPAFQLTLWQNGKEVSAYPIGIGHKDFPLPVGERETSAIIFNPNWIPQDSAWSSGVAVTPPGKTRLSKIKIPLGEGCMIREASNAKDIGRAVSRGCILMLSQDLLDLANKLAMTRNLPVSKSRLGRLRGATNGGERIVATLDPPVLVDINYDLQVVEGRKLRLYPDVYDRGAFALDSLRAELQSAGVATSGLGDQSLRRILDRAGGDSQFVINVADVRKGRLRRGRKLPLVAVAVKKRREIAYRR